MGGDQQPNPEASQQRHQLLLSFSVHPAGRLVEQDRNSFILGAWIPEHDRQREPLFLAAAEVTRVALGEARAQADAC